MYLCPSCRNDHVSNILAAKKNCSKFSVYCGHSVINPKGHFLPKPDNKWLNCHNFHNYHKSKIEWKCIVCLHWPKESNFLHLSNTELPQKVSTLPCKWLVLSPSASLHCIIILCHFKHRVSQANHVQWFSHRDWKCSWR